MNESDWFRWTSPTAILKCLGARATRFQYALFLCACWRRCPNEHPHLRERHAIEQLERFCLDQISFDELHRHLPDLPMGHPEVLLSTPSVTGNMLLHEIEWARLRVMQHSPDPAAEQVEKLAQGHLLRCIVGNPYTPPAVDSNWLHWNGGEIPRLAESIHRDRRFEDMPILGDALEDAGCQDSAILEHCRSRREHALGCWVLSLLRAQLRLRLILTSPESHPAGWRPDAVEFENVTLFPVSLSTAHTPTHELGLLTLDTSGIVADHLPPQNSFSESASPRILKIGPGERLRFPLGPTRSLPPGIYTMQALYHHEGIDLRSQAFLFTVPTEQ